MSEGEQNNKEAQKTSKPQSKYQKFLIEGFELNERNGGLEIVLKYGFDEQVKLSEKLFLPKVPEGRVKELGEILERAVRSLLIVGGISYYKADCSQEIAGIKIGRQESGFWKKLYERGLGEFFYQNKLDFRNLINFSAIEHDPAQAEKIILKERALIPLGGGKDSLVSVDIVTKSGLDFWTFSLRDADPIRQTAEIIGKPRLVVQREIDPKLIEMNKNGAYNGHVPITAYISFLLAVVALVYDFKYLVISLEKSANSGQTEYLGMDINHQYSKSEEFENDFRAYLKHYIANGIEYFSILRGFFEIKIAKIFANMHNFDEFYRVCTSCNRNFKIVKTEKNKLWCGECPKCVFVFGIFAPFIDKKRLIEMFGKNLFSDENLLDLFEETWGIRNFKPFECVGTFEESQLAMQLVSQKQEWQEDLVVKHFLDKINQGKIDVEQINQSNKDMFCLLPNTNLPEIFAAVIKKYEDR